MTLTCEERRSFNLPSKSAPNSNVQGTSLPAWDIREHQIFYGYDICIVQLLDFLTIIVHLSDVMKIWYAKEKMAKSLIYSKGKIIFFIDIIQILESEYHHTWGLKHALRPCMSSKDSRDIVHESCKRLHRLISKMPKLYDHLLPQFVINHRDGERTSFILQKAAIVCALKMKFQVYKNIHVSQHGRIFSIIFKPFL